MDKDVIEKMEYTIIIRTLQTLCTLCAMSEEKTIELLTGWHWDEEEAGKIKLLLRDLG